MISASFAPTRVPQHSMAAPDGYVYCPKKLAHDCANLPHVIGVYLLIGRLYLLGDRLPVPLSAHDLVNYDPSLSYGAAVRALDRLACLGWLHVHIQRGQKSSYVPTWGPGKGECRPWQLGTRVLGRPAGVHAACIDQRLLDLCMGKLDPHRQQRALITRFVARPLLTMEDVGIYAQVRTHHVGTSLRLCALGLLTSNGQACDLPPERELLALASQHSLFDVQAGLSAQGWERLGVSIEAPATPSSTPLFFVPPDMIAGSITPLIGNLIGNLITDVRPADSAPRALERHETPVQIAAISCSPMQPIQPIQPNITTKRILTQTPVADDPIQQQSVAMPSKPQRQNAPPTPTTLRLNEKSLNPKSVRELANLPLDAVDHVIAYVETQVSDETYACGTIVNLLREYRNTGELPTLSSQGRTRLEWQQQCRLSGKDANYGDVITEDIHNVLTEQPWGEASEALPPTTTVPDDEQTSNVTQGLVGAAESPHGSVSECTELTKAIQQHLQRCLPRSFAASIAMVRVRGDAAAVVLECASKTHTLEVERSMLNPIRQLLLEQNDRRDLRIGVRPARPLAIRQQETSEANRPPWICVERWAVLPRMLRATLIGSRLEQGVVYTASPYLQQTLETRHGSEVAELIAMAVS